MGWINSIEVLSKLIPIAQILIVLLTVFTIWATVHRGSLEKKEKAKLAQEIVSTKELTVELSSQNTELESELTNTKKELTDLKTKTAPRSLTEEQKAILLANLPAPPDFQVAAACRLMDNESFNFANELMDIFRDGKWEIGKLNRSFLDDIENDVAVAITDDSQKAVSEKVIIALRKVGLKSGYEKIRKETISGIQENTLYLIVGARKPSL